MNSKYLKYALGEIALVVIGILIALSINNWNEDRKSSKLELKLLNEIYVDIKEDSVQLKNESDGIEQVLLYAKKLKERLNSDLPYSDTLDYYFANVSALFIRSFNYAAYETLNQAGLNLISNDSLRLKIPEYYFELQKIEDVGDEYDLPVFFRTVIYPKYFRSFAWGKKGAKPKNYELLKRSSDFLVALDYVINDSFFYLGNYDKMIEQNIELLGLIRNELKARD